MGFLEAFLNVVAIIGIIVAGGFIVFFLGDLLLTVLEPKRKQNNEQNVQELSYNENQTEEVNYTSYEDYKRTKSNKKQEDMGYVTEFVADEPAQPAIQEENDDIKPIDFDSALAEQRNLSPVSQTQTVEDDFSSSFASFDEHKVEETKDEDFDSLFGEDDFTDAFDFNFDDFEDVGGNESKAVAATNDETITESNTETTSMAQTVTETTVVVPTASEETVVTMADLDDSKWQAEVALLKEELEAQKVEYEKLRLESELNASKWKNERIELEKLYVEADNQAKEPQKPLLTIDEYEARLETLKARLKVNEKELKENKKEFLPLRKVRKTLDSDKKKLRRREALVAKQKVVLYGVNNIMEIDEEKAKKLPEDLDLLDGLKVSVQHCEEVMENNKERYPILETTYRILTTVNQDLKDDIAECERNIAILKGDIDSDEAVKEAKAIVNEKPAPELVVVEKTSVKAEKEEIKPVKAETKVVKIEEDKEEKARREELLKAERERVKAEKEAQKAEKEAEKERLRAEKQAEKEAKKQEKAEKIKAEKAEKEEKIEEIKVEEVKTEKPKTEKVKAEKTEVKSTKVEDKPLSPAEELINSQASFKASEEEIEVIEPKPVVEAPKTETVTIETTKVETVKIEKTSELNTNLDDDFFGLDFDEEPEDFDFEKAYSFAPDIMKNFATQTIEIKKPIKQEEKVEEKKEKKEKTVKAETQDTAPRRGGRPKKTLTDDDDIL